MEKKSSLTSLQIAIFFLFSMNNLYSQNVGIGNATPVAKLDVATNTIVTPTAVMGLSTANNGTGVWGECNSGVQAYGVYGKSTSGYAGFFDGKIVVTDKIGINVESPAYPLSFETSFGDKISLFGTSGPHFGIGVQGDLLQIHTNNNISDIGFGYGTSSVFNSNVVFKGNGRVGIGTSNPLGMLDVAGSIRMVDGNQAVNKVMVSDANGMASWQTLSAFVSGTGTANYIPKFTPDGKTIANSLIFDNGVNVGINTTAPAAKLDVRTSVSILAIQGLSTTTNGTGLHGVCNVGISAYGVYGESSTGYAGYFNGKMQVTDKIGIGTVPSYPIDARGNSQYTGNFVNTSNSTDNVGVQGTCTNTPFYGFGIIGSGGFKGVEGKATIAGIGDRYGLHGMGENGTANNFGVRGAASGGANAFGVYGQASGGGNNWAGYFSGPAYCNSGVWTASDRMLKNNIQPLSDAMAIINQLRPSVYTFKTTEYKQMHLPEGLQYGLIADELKQVVPEAVKKAVQPAVYENQDEQKGKKLHEEVGFNAVNYTALIPILVGAAKEQQLIITAQQKEIEDLKRRLSAVEMEK